MAEEREVKFSERYKIYKENKAYLNGNGNLVSLYFERFNACFKIFILGKVYLPYIEMVVTTKCSLRCKDCSNLMQYYNKPYDVDFEVIKKSIEKLTNAVDKIQIFRILGGEPFLYPYLDEMLKILISCQKIKVIGIPTNGTILPPKEVISLLKNSKVRLDISDYGVRDIDNVLQMCRREGVRHSITKDKVWEDRGDMVHRGRTEKELDLQMQQCNQPCRNILNGKMFRCPRASHGDDLGIIKTPSDELVDLLVEKPVAKLREEIAAVYYRKKYVEACNYCDMGTKNLKKIPAGMQVQ